MLLHRLVFSFIITIGVITAANAQCGMMGSGSGSHDHGKKTPSSQSHDHNQPQNNTKGYAFINDDGMQEATITIKDGYQPNTIVVKKGIPMRLNFNLQEEKCTGTVVFKDFDIEQELTPFETTMVAFAPDSAGLFSFNCPMNMITGTLVVKE